VKSVGAEDNIVARNNKENNERVRTTSTTIAEEAVDQLQASEKLIAGNSPTKPSPPFLLIDNLIQN
jgi:hypothetical protein